MVLPVADASAVVGSSNRRWRLIRMRLRWAHRRSYEVRSQQDSGHHDEVNDVGRAICPILQNGSSIVTSARRASNAVRALVIPAFVGRSAW